MRKWLFLILLLAVIGGILYYITFGYYSDGTRVGTLIKLSRKGFVFKTHEGQLMLGGMTDGTGTFTSSMWEFSVDDNNTAAIETLNLSQRTGQRVSAHYEEKFFQLPWNGDTKYFVTSVELIPVAGQPRVAAPTEVPPPPPPPAPVDSAAATK